MKLSHLYDHLSIKNKLLAFALFPLISVFVFSLTIILEKYHDYSNASQVSEFTRMNTYLVELTRSLQKERSFSYRLGIKTSEATWNMVSAQRTLTDQIVEEMSVVMAGRDPANRYWGLEAEFTFLIAGLQQLSAIRKAVDIHGVDPSDFYADVNSGIRRINEKLQVMSRDLELARLGHQLNTLLTLEERAWQEADIVLSVIEKGQVDADEYRKVSTLIADQASLLDQLSLKSQPGMSLNPWMAGSVAEASLLRDRALRLAINQATRSSQFEALLKLVNYRRYLAAPGGQREEPGYSQHLSLIDRDAQLILNQLLNMPEVKPGEREILLALSAEFSADGQQFNIEKGMDAWQLALRDQTRGLSADAWLVSAGERGKGFETLTLTAQNRVLIRAEDIMQSAVRALLLYSLVSMFVFVTTIYLGYLLMARFVREILAISSAMREMSSAGEFDTQLNVQGTDEIADMAAAFNAMNRDRFEYEQRHRKIKSRLLEMEKQHSQQLEARVAIRTRELEAATEQAQLASEAKSRFLGNVSHHIRTPLNAILGFSQMLLSDRRIESDQQSRLETIRENGRNLLGLVDDILLLVDLETARVEASHEDINLGHLLKNLKDKYAIPASTKGLALNTAIATDLPQAVIGDEEKLGKVLSLLTENAIKFTETGVINLDASVDASVDDTGGSYRVSVEDTGPGMPADQRDLLTRSFEQVQEGCEAQSGGVGIGLTIADRLARVMGGELLLKQGAGGGLRVDVRLPLIPGRHMDGFRVETRPVASNVEVPVCREPVAIPAGLIDEVTRALESADYLELLEKAERIKQLDVSLGARVTELIEGYQYEALDSLMAECAAG